MDPTSIPPDELSSSGRSEPTPAEVREQLERMLASPGLQSSPRRRDMLRFIVDETLAQRGNRLKAYTVALAVFGRDDTFDPQADPVVRLEARRLRRDLDGYYAGAGRHDPLHITVPKGGYVPTFLWRDDLNPAPPPLPVAGNVEIDPESEASTRTNETTPWWPGLRVRIAMMIGIALVVAGAWYGLHETNSPPDAAYGLKVLVLPFQALSNSDNDRFLASGISEELITNLMRFSGLRLYSVPASFNQDPTADPLATGRRLGTPYVVSGSVRSSASAVRIAVKLTDTSSNQVIWSEAYKRPLVPRLIQELQSDVAVEIASKLGQPYGILKSKAANYSSTVHEPSLSSFDCILRAYAYRRNFKIELYGPARRCLEETVHRDPNYADAWAMLGWLRLDAVRFASSADGDTKDTLGEAFDAASRAVSLDNNNVMALQALSSIIFYMGQYAESEKIQRQALALNPNDPDTLAQLGWRLAVRGNWDEGIPLLQHAIDRTVNPPGWYYYLIAIHSYLEGAYADMLSEAEHSTGDGTGLGQSLIAIAQGALGKKDAARRALAKMAAISPLLARDPATVYRRHQATDEIVNALVAGLRKAGWSEPVTPAQ